MANEKQQPANPTAPKMVRARVVSNYGRHIPGALVEVSEAEYSRLRDRDPAGGHRFPVLISQVDADALEAKRRADEEKARAAHAAADTERSTSEGWADYQNRASEELAAKRVEEQRRQQAILTGAPVAEDPETARARFQENVAAGRGV